MDVPDDEWNDWLLRRERRENAQKGRPWFLSSSPVPEPEKHNPSRLRRCHRKTYYQALNAPEEKAEPRGIFYTGRRVEEDLVLPYLSEVTSRGRVVGNNLDVYFTEDWRGIELRVSGDTDPVVLDESGSPLLPTEVKTADGLPSEPRRHHADQLHAYMKGLSERYERTMDEGVMVYVDRVELRMRTFRVGFDGERWESLLDWMVEQTRYREREELPPADPEYEWECDMCPFRERCRRDLEPGDGLVEGVDYPSRKLREWVSAKDGDVVLPPVVARDHPGLVEEDPVKIRGWECKGCGVTIRWDDRRVDPDADEPVCPECAEDGSLHRLVPEGLDAE